MPAERPMRSPVVPVAPNTGKSRFAIAAPPCTLTIARSTAATGGSVRRGRATERDMRANDSASCGCSNSSVYLLVVVTGHGVLHLSNGDYFHLDSSPLIGG